MSRWKRFQYPSIFDPVNIPSQEGVYVIFADGKPLYIGESTNICSRIASHGKEMNGIVSKTGEPRNIWITKWGSFERIDIAFRTAKSYGESALAERRLIKKLPSTKNIRHADKPNAPYRVSRKKSIHNKIVTRQQVNIARWYYGFANMPMSQIAKEVGLGFCATYNICSGKTFRDVT